MAGQALSVIGRILPYDVDMRVVTGNAADAGIGAVETLAVAQSVRLKANCEFAPPVVPHHGFPTAMTLPAKVRDIFRREFAQVWWS